MSAYWNEGQDPSRTEIDDVLPGDAEQPRCLPSRQQTLAGSIGRHGAIVTAEHHKHNARGLRLTNRPHRSHRVPANERGERQARASSQSDRRAMRTAGSDAQFAGDRRTGSQTTSSGALLTNTRPPCRSSPSTTTSSPR